MTDRVVSAGFDLAALSGVAWGAPFVRPQVALWNIGDPDPGQRGLNLMKRARIFLDEVRPDRVYVEAPLQAHVATSAGHSKMTTISLNGYVFLMMTVCASRGIPVQLIERQSVLQHFVGRSRFSEKNMAKEACVARCRQLGYGDLSFDEADAVALKDKGDADHNPRAFALAGVDRAVRMSRNARP